MGYLLDEHFSPRVARALRERGIEAYALREFAGGRYLGAQDPEILEAAREAGLVFVSFDVHSIPRTLRQITEAGGEHGGVVLVSVRTFRQDNVGGLVEVLERLHRRLEREGSRNRVLFLSRQPG